MRVVIAGAEAHESCVVIVEAAGVAKGLEAGGCVFDDVSKSVVAELLGDGVDKLGGDGVGCIEFGDGIQVVFVEPVGFLQGLNGYE